MTESEATKRAPGPASTATLPADRRLARRAAQRDERAFTTIFKRYHQELYRFCLSILGNAEDARDALQNTMVKALQALPGEQREIRLKPWLYRVAHNESIDLLRKRRETTPVDPELAAPGDGLAETAAQRERLRQLLLDLGDLAERQRAALLMRELGGLGFEQIAEAFDTSPAVIRQTVYEARVNLRGLEEGREMSCEEVMHRLSNADGRVSRRRDLRAHLRACPDCRAFRDAIDARQRDFAVLAPLPALASAGVLHAVLGGASGSVGGVGGATGGATVVAGAGKAVSAGLVAKSVATVAVAVAVGASAADRGGLIHTPLPGGSQGAPAAQSVGEGGSPDASPGMRQPSATSAGSGGSGGGNGSAGPAAGKGVRGESAKNADHAPGGGPPAAAPGRGTAAEHRNGGSGNPARGRSHGGPAASHSPHRSHRSHVRHRASHPHPAPPPPPPEPSQKEGSAQQPAETTPKAEQSSGSASENSGSGAGSEGMP
jgi:RNA polymerase sigma factor (sigma-70 family)